METAGKAMKKQGGHPEQKKSKEYAYILFAPIWKPWVSEEWERKLAIGYEQIQI